jgi:U3 small nucleolar RNA-associated protein 25
MDDANLTTTRLLTLLNVSAVKTGKRKRTFDDSTPAPKLNKRKSVLFADLSNDGQTPAASNNTADDENAAVHLDAEVEHKDPPEENESQSTSKHVFTDAVLLEQVY